MGLTFLEAGYEGPNIYVRILLALRSTVPAEQDYALHHLVKISHERGDKYKVEAFPTLAETLIEYALSVSSLFYNVQWEVDYTEKKFDLNTLDGINGTPDILQRIQSLKRIDSADELEPEELALKFTKVNEAGLALRNLSTLEANAVYLSTLPQLRDYLSIVLNLPPSDQVTELKLNILDIAEEVTQYWSMDVSDPLYRSLLDQLDNSSDRGTILRAIRAICKISLNLEEPNQLRGVPVSIIKRLFEWLLLEDEELVEACLDFLYQFVLISDNVGVLIANAEELSLPFLMSQFGHLLQHETREVTEKVLVYPAIRPAPAKEIPTVPRELLNHFLQYDEPERSNRWLKSVLEENPESDITQIALWQAYQAAFTRFVPPHKALLVASDFIKNVSTVFAGANAQVVTGPSSKFIIKGIQPRHAPIDSQGRACLKCKWDPPTAEACSQFFLNPTDLYHHFLSGHLDMTLGEDNRWIGQTRTDESVPMDCYWAGCHYFSRLEPGTRPVTSRLVQHFRQHLPHESTQMPKMLTPAGEPYAMLTSFDPEVLAMPATSENFPFGRPAIYHEIKYEVTPVDDAGEPTGVALCALLVLRNIARNLPEALFLLGGQTPNGGFYVQRGDPLGSAEAWMAKLFGPLKWPLTHLWASNRTLGSYAFDTMTLVRKFQGF
jgi:chromatin structure-remodeling complex subunit RSC9